MRKRFLSFLLIVCLVLQFNLFNLPMMVKASENLENTNSKIIEGNYAPSLSSIASEANKYQSNKYKQIKIKKEKHNKITINKSFKDIQNDIEWNLQMINANNNSESEFQIIDKVKVAIIDSGIDYTDDIDVKERKNFIPEQNDISITYEDLTGHGTAIAGILAAKNNGEGVTGINPNVEIYSARVLDDTNTAPISRLIDAIEWAMEKDVNIISISFGTDTDSDALKAVIQKAYDAGILIIAAAGNGGIIEYPAVYDEVVAVGSVDNNGQICQLSSAGEELELVAPGKLINSTGAFGGEIVSSGTSMAVPHVVGVASLLWEKDLSASSDFIRKLMDYSANLYGDPLEYGDGLIDLAYALSVYDEFKSIYNQNNDINSSIEVAEENNIILSNTNPVTVFNDVDYVEGSWIGTDHEYTITNAVTTASNNLSSTAIKIIKKGCIYQDYYSSGLSGMTTNPLWHGYWCQKDSLGNYIYSANFIAGAIYISRLARVGGDYTKVSFPSTADSRDAAAMVGKVTTSYINGVPWNDSKILGTTYTNNATNRKYFLYGMAIHIATDTFAHSTYYYDSTQGDWIYIDHASGADVSSGSTINEKRYKAAKLIAIYGIWNCCYDWEYDISHYYLDSVGALPGMLNPDRIFDGTFVVRNICRYSQVINPELYAYGFYEYYLQFGDYAYNGGR